MSGLGFRGSFFDLDKDLWKAGGSFEANPPFTEVSSRSPSPRRSIQPAQRIAVVVISHISLFSQECMQLMMETIQHILEHNEVKNTPTSYLVRTPHSPPASVLLLMSSRCRLSCPPGPTSAPTKSCEKASG
jgi:hypothetical protein